MKAKQFWRPKQHVFSELAKSFEHETREYDVSTTKKHLPNIGLSIGKKCSDFDKIASKGFRIE
jgi:hypothetical protein